MAEKRKTTTTKQFWLAVLIIAPAFVLIGTMLFMNHSLTSEFTEKLTAENQNATVIEKRLEAFKEIERSNETIFNILLPVFGAWVGAVVAFYFGSVNLDKAQQTVEVVQQTLAESLSKQAPDISISELLEKSPMSRQVITSTLQEELKLIEKKGEMFGNVVVVNDQKEPIGVLYIADLYKVNEKWDDVIKSTTLGDFIDKNELVDRLTGLRWTEEGVKNYASLSLENKISEARQKLNAIKSNDNEVCGIVLQDGKVIAIVNNNTISKALEK